MKKRLLLALVVLTGIFLLNASIVLAAPAPVAKTGQTTKYRTGDDGSYQKGVATSPRFTDNGDATVTDNLTGLMWTKDASRENNWDDAIDYANSLSLGSEGCGTSYTDWRLPNIKELQSLIDYGNTEPAFPTEHPFTNVLSSFYWSSTTDDFATGYAWYVGMNYGFVFSSTKPNSYYVWPVRGGN